MWAQNHHLSEDEKILVNQQFTQQKVKCRASLKTIRAIARNWGLCCSYLLSAVQVHTTTYCKFYREQLGLVTIKAGPGQVTVLDLVE